jgi:hypothetical protein
MVTAGLAKSLRAAGQRGEAIRSYRRAVESPGADPALLSEFLGLVAEEQGVVGLLRELPAYKKKVQVGQDVRLNATLSSFDAWAFLAVGNDKVASEFLIQVTPLVGLATETPTFTEDEGLACGVLLQIVSEKLGDTNRSRLFANYLKRFPIERVTAMRKVFALPTPK